jgi:hypothetical protein
MLHVWMLTLLVATGAQDLPKGQFPDGWTVRVDATGGHAGPAAAPASGTTANDIAFVTMKPGWHITTGPAAILYQPAPTRSSRRSSSSTQAIARKRSASSSAGGTSMGRTRPIPTS